MDDLYAFVFRGQLADAALDKVGRLRSRHLLAAERADLAKSLSYEFLDNDLVDDAERMAIVYSAIHAFENMVRQLVMKSMAEEHGEGWWSSVPNSIRSKVKSRMEEDANFRWHGRRGGSEITYCDFGDLSSIITTNWPQFQDLLVNQQWANQLLDTLERSRNIIMHGGILDEEDIERIGMNIRDWIRQVG